MGESRWSSRSSEWGAYGQMEACHGPRELAVSLHPGCELLKDRELASLSWVTPRLWWVPPVRA